MIFDGGGNVALHRPRDVRLKNVVGVVRYSNLVMKLGS
jgi:hypothetical protein